MIFRRFIAACRKHLPALLTKIIDDLDDISTNIDQLPTFMARLSPLKLSPVAKLLGLLNL
jgi:hypothetical protein